MLNFRSLFILTTIAFGLLSPVFADSKRKCFSHPSSEKTREAETHFSANRVAAPSNRQATTYITVYFHVIYDEDDNQTGNLSDDVISEQMNVLNDGFYGTDLMFELESINRVRNSNWFNNAGPNSTETMQVQTEMKQQLRQGGSADLNVYTVGFSAEENQGILGYATFPYDYAGNPNNDGVVLVYASLPNVDTDQPYSEGKTLVHETGHWTGLYHVFQGGCDGAGDEVSDTPPQGTATDGCPASKDTCPGGGVDSIHNYMDYSDDECLNSFTEGQIDRFWDQISTYRL